MTYGHHTVVSRCLEDFFLQESTLKSELKPVADTPIKNILNPLSVLTHTNMQKDIIIPSVAN